MKVYDDADDDNGNELKQKSTPIERAQAQNLYGTYLCYPYVIDHIQLEITTAVAN